MLHAAPAASPHESSLVFLLMLAAVVLGGLLLGALWAGRR
jgi:hypothetical protein